MSAAQKIPLVEPDPVVRHPLAQFLRDCGFKVIEATGNHEAASVLRDEATDVALLDATSDTKEAFSLAQWIRTNAPETSVIIAGSLEGAVEKASQLCEANPSRVQKPYEPDSLVQLITRMRSARDKTNVT
jgi:DNA-binding response OmpR family regulator